MKRTLLYLIVTICTSLFFAPSHAVYAQETKPAEAAATTSAAPKKEESKTIFKVIQEGGLMMIPLFATSCILVALIIDSSLRLRKDKLAPPEIVDQLRSQFRAGDYNGSFQTCKGRPGFLTNVVRNGLSMCGHGKHAAERAMEDSLYKESTNLMTRIRYMSVIGVVTPMMGLTGTVLGMMGAFSTIGAKGIGDPSALAAAIGEVLVATLTGLAVAIPGFFFFYFFGNRVTATTAHAEDVINGLFRGMPYDQLANLEIGDDPVYAAPPSPALLSQKSGGAPQDTIACPTCHSAVVVGSAQCPNCHTPLNWAA